MATRTLNLAATIAWLLACAMLCVLAFDPLRSEAARMAVVACAFVDIMAALGFSLAAHWRMVATEQVIEAIVSSLDATLQVAQETRSNNFPPRQGAHGPQGEPASGTGPA